MYKRQLQAGKLRTYVCDFPTNRLKDHPRAVSYTHLDVYKRQPFTLPDEALDKPFLAEAKTAGLLTLAGHRSVGGMRASIYNAVPLAGVKALVDFMADFQKRHG